MWNRTITPLIFIFIILITGGCMVKNTLKKGAAYEAAGMFKDASELYYKTCLKRPKKPEVKIALKRSGQLYIEDQAENIAQSFNRGDYKATVYDYITTRDFVEKVVKAGVDLKPDPAMKRYFDDAKENYLAQRYEAGQKNIGEQKYDEAKATFFEIFKIDPDYKDTRNYLKQATFEPIYQDGARLYGEGKYMEAYRKWNSIFEQDRNYSDVADRMKQALNERYKQGSVYLMNENFQDAATALGEVHLADPSFKDVKLLFTEARNEPVYRKGNAFLASGKCRTAYYAFDNVVKDAGTYKDAAGQREKALDCAQFPIAVKTSAYGGRTSAPKQFQALLISQLISQKNLFLKVYDLSVVDPRIEQLLVNLSGNFNEELLRQLGNKQNIKAVLYIDFTEFSRNEGTLTKVEKTGFERIVTKKATGETSTVDKQVKYEESSKKNSVTVTLTYKLVSVANGEILISDRVSENKKDEIRYASYFGTNDNLYPSSFQGGICSIDIGNYRALQNLVRASKSITSVETLTDKIFESVSRKIAGNINNFNPEK
jgi:tetratricopeptide (TPR) repeat protein